jgi:hypothetical protein
MAKHAPDSYSAKQRMPAAARWALNAPYRSHSDSIGTIGKEKKAEPSARATSKDDAIQRALTREQREPVWRLELDHVGRELEEMRRHPPRPK